MIQPPTHSIESSSTTEGPLLEEPEIVALLEKGRQLCISGQFDEIPDQLNHIAQFNLTPKQAIMFETLQLYPGASSHFTHDTQRLQRANNLLELAQVLDSTLTKAWIWEAMQMIQNNLLLHHAALHSNAMAVDLFEQCDHKLDAFNVKVSRCLIMIPCEMYREVIEMSGQLLEQREHLDPVALCNVLRSTASANYFLGVEADNQHSLQFLHTALNLHEECLAIATDFQIHKFELISHTNIAIINACLGRREATTFHLLKIEGMHIKANNINASWVYWLRYCEVLLLCQSMEHQRGWQELLQLDRDLQQLDLSVAAVHDSVLRKIISIGRRWGFLEIALAASQTLAELNSKRRRLLSKTLSDTVEDIMTMPKLLHKNQQLSQHGRQLETSLARQNAELNTTLERLQAEANIRKKAEYALYQAHAKLEEQIQKRTHELELAMDLVMRQEKQLALGRLVVGIAHELNTPLGNALMASSTMDDRCQQLLRDINGTSLKRSQLNANLLALSEGHQLLARSLQVASNLVQRFRTLAIEQHDEDIVQFDVVQLCEQLALAWHHQFQERGAVLHLNLPAQLTMQGYPKALSQVLEQLLENTLMHGLAHRQNGAAELTLQVRFQELQLSLSDNGTGIDQQHLARLFEPFFSRQLGQGGMGLGLSIAHSLVTDLMQGQITISNLESGGTKVLLRLPQIRKDKPGNRSV